MIAFALSLPSKLMSSLRGENGCAARSDFLDGLKAREIGEGVFEAVVNKNVRVTFSQKLPGLFKAAANEVFITDLHSFEPGKGNLRKAFQTIRDTAQDHHVDLLVKVKELAFKKDEEFERFANFLVKDFKFEQSGSHYDQFILSAKPRLS